MENPPRLLDADVVIRPNMCEKFHYDRLRNDGALGNGNLITTRTTKTAAATTTTFVAIGDPTRFRVRKLQCSVTKSQAEL